MKNQLLEDLIELYDPDFTPPDGWGDAPINPPVELAMGIFTLNDNPFKCSIQHSPSEEHKDGYNEDAVRYAFQTALDRGMLTQVITSLRSISLDLSDADSDIFVDNPLLAKSYQDTDSEETRTHIRAARMELFIKMLAVDIPSPEYASYTGNLYISDRVVLEMAEEFVMWLAATGYGGANLARSLWARTIALATMSRLNHPNKYEVDSGCTMGNSTQWEHHTFFSREQLIDYLLGGDLSQELLTAYGPSTVMFLVEALTALAEELDVNLEIVELRKIVLSNTLMCGAHAWRCREAVSIYS